MVSKLTEAVRLGEGVTLADSDTERESDRSADAETLPEFRSERVSAEMVRDALSTADEEALHVTVLDDVTEMDLLVVTTAVLVLETDAVSLLRSDRVGKDSDAVLLCVTASVAVAERVKVAKALSVCDGTVAVAAAEAVWLALRS